MVKFLRRRNPSIEQHRHKAEDQNGKDHEIQLEDLASLLEKDLSDLPDTLILTAEFDPLRDEGEEFGKRLKEAGNQVEMHRIKDALHGFFALGIQFLHVRESFTYMNAFLQKEA